MNDGQDIDFEGLARWHRDYPAVRPLPKEGVFEVGLCMAGAVSAGAYTAGVLDFLIEALDAFAQERASRADLGSPLHEVRVPVVGGASAGGMCAAIAAVFLDTRFPPVRASTPKSERDRNPLYRAWVSGVDIRPMLGDRDVRKNLRDQGACGPGPASLLDCTVLDGIVDELLDRRADPAIGIAERPWLANPLRAVLTLSNLRGVPYALRTENGNLHHWMSHHADHVRFAVRLHPMAKAWEAPGDAKKIGETDLDCAMARGDSRRARFKDVALGTGGFPVALAPRVLNRLTADYEYRAALTPTGPLRRRTALVPEPDWARRLAPVWPNPKSETYAALCVDGGATNNEPLDLVRRVLAGYRGSSPRKPEDARRAILLIDPFPNPGKLGPEEDQGLIGSILPLFNALVQNARFKPEDLAMASDTGVGSRFLVTPSRDPPSQVAVTGDGVEMESAIAAGHLSGFLGFFAETYREHDFFLGRRNAQQFLREHFVLPENNVLFQGRWSENDKEKWRAKSKKGEARWLPIIPLCGRLLNVEEEAPSWPAGSFDPAEIRPLIERRVEVVFPALRDAVLRLLSAEDDRPPPWHRRLAGSAVGWWLKPRLVEKAMDKLQTEVTKLNNRRH